MTRKSFHFAVLAVVLAAAAYSVRHAWASLHPQPMQPLRICMPQVSSAASIAYADVEGLFRRQGLDVTIEWVPSGRVALERMLTGECDLALCRETPLALMVLRGRPVRILASVATAEEAREILVRKGRGIVNPTDLRGKRIGYVRETSSDFSLDTVLDFNGIPLDGVQRVPGDPTTLMRSMEDGELDALCIWSPHRDRLLAEFPAQIEQLETEVLSRAYWNVVGTNRLGQDFVARALRAMAEASEAIESDPAAAAVICSSAMDMPADDLRRDWAKGSFEVQLDQGLLLALESCARWSLLKGYAPPQPVPDFLTVIAPQALVQVDPQLVSMVHPAAQR